ncbi:uncharacterized protein LOC135397285 [Ornithodoros turicata]|uniref:Putative salivary secreted protein n=1 Tax=Ornithodoros turicata TaxID=34597 RepID=A0A2R5LA77_9ACAR
MANHVLVFVALAAFAVLAAEGFNGRGRGPAWSRGPPGKGRGPPWSRGPPGRGRGGGGGGGNPLSEKGCAKFCRGNLYNSSQFQLTNSSYSCDCSDPLPPTEDSGTSGGDGTSGPVVNDRAGDAPDGEGPVESGNQRNDPDESSNESTDTDGTG